MPIGIFGPINIGHLVSLSAQLEVYVIVWLQLLSGVRFKWHEKEMKLTKRA